MIPQFDKKKISRHFTEAAPNYDNASVVQRQSADNLLETARTLPLDPERILDVGCGTGYASHRLRSLFPQAFLVSLDLAAGMLRHARIRFGLGNSFNGLSGDAESLPFKSGSVDLIFTNAALQWCNQIERTLAGFRKILKPGGYLLGATFGPGTHREITRAWETVDPNQGHAHRADFPKLSDWTNMFRSGNWDARSLEAKLITLHFTTPREALDSVRRVGAKNALTRKRKSLTGKKMFSRFLNELEKLREPGGIPLTYELIYFKAVKPVTGPASEPCKRESA